MPIQELLQWLQHHKPLVWTHPTTTLGTVARQLRNLDATGRIMEQRPSFLQHLVSSTPEQWGDEGVREMVPMTGRLVLAYRKWQATLATLASLPEGNARTRAFQSARRAYEEEMFGAALDAEVNAE
jgi:hypothetical protein